MPGTQIYVAYQTGGCTAVFFAGDAGMNRAFPVDFTGGKTIQVME